MHEAMLAGRGCLLGPLCEAGDGGWDSCTEDGAPTTAPRPFSQVH